MRTALQPLTAVLALFFVCLPDALDGRQRVERDAVYKWHYGTALLLDIYHPEEPNGAAIVWINGSGFHVPPRLGWQLKAAERMHRAQPYLDAGFTILSINHRAAPEFRYPAALEDAQRAVRFARANAERLGLDPRLMAARGTSSGGHLASLLGTVDAAGDPEGPDPVDRSDAKVSAVVSLRGSYDLTDSPSFPSGPARAVTSLIGTTYEQVPALYAQASAITHLSMDDASFLVVHGDADDVIPISQAEKMMEALRVAGVHGDFVRLRGAGHGWSPTVYDESHAAAWLTGQLFGQERADELRPLFDAHHDLVAAWAEVEVSDVTGAMEVLSRSQAAHERLTVPAWYWNRVCWNGATHRQAEAVIDACNEAVRLDPDDPEVRDSRGLARALQGDREGAISDFEFFLERVTDEGRLALRSAWVEELRAGSDPFDDELLRRLRGGA
jgi:acetyl esterase/lipase